MEKNAEKVEKQKFSEWVCLYPEMFLDPVAYFLSYPIIPKSHMTKNPKIFQKYTQIPMYPSLLSPGGLYVGVRETRTAYFVPGRVGHGPGSLGIFVVVVSSPTLVGTSD